MIGVLCVAVSKNNQREKTIKYERFGEVTFCVVSVKIRSFDGFWDKHTINAAMRALKKEGIYRITVPDCPYIKGLLERYNMTEVSHLPLMRVIAGQLLLFAKTELGENASVAIYAKKVDADVISCINTACDNFKLVQLDIGEMTETIRRKMMDDYGSSPVIGELSDSLNPKIRVLFDRPGEKLPNPKGELMSLNLSGRPLEDDNCFDDIEAEFSGITLPVGTDLIGVFSEIIKNCPALVSYLKIVSLVKKT